MAEQQTVFVIDDDQAVRESLHWLLESVGYQVCSYASAHEFLNVYDGTSPGCLVLDVRIPGMSGLELQNYMLERDWCLPVIIARSRRRADGGACDKKRRDRFPAEAIQRPDLA